jgi:hypothetical protein
LFTDTNDSENLTYTNSIIPKIGDLVSFTIGDTVVNNSLTVFGIIVNFFSLKSSEEELNSESLFFIIFYNNKYYIVDRMNTEIIFSFN